MQNAVFRYITLVPSAYTKSSRYPQEYKKMKMYKLWNILIEITGIPGTSASKFQHYNSINAGQIIHF